MSPRVLVRVSHQIGVLRRAPRGDRFQELNRRRREGGAGRARRTFNVAVGTLLIVTALVTYPIPGPPSTLMILLGLTLIAQELVWVARTLDGLELRLHARHRLAVSAWRRLGTPTKAMIVLASLAFLAGCAGGVFLLFAGE